MLASNNSCHPDWSDPVTRRCQVDGEKPRDGVNISCLEDLL